MRRSCVAGTASASLSRRHRRQLVCGPTARGLSAFRKRSWNHLQALRTFQLCPSSLRPEVHRCVLRNQGRLLNLCPRQCGTVSKMPSKHTVDFARLSHESRSAEEWSAWQPPATDDHPETDRRKCPVQACEEQGLKLFEQWLPSNLKQNAYKTAPRTVLSMRRVLNMVRIEFADCSGYDIDEKVWCIAVALGLHRNQLINPLFGLPVLDPKHSRSRCMLVALKHFVCFAKSIAVEMQMRAGRDDLIDMSDSFKHVTCTQKVERRAELHDRRRTVCAWKSCQTELQLKLRCCRP